MLVNLKTILDFAEKNNCAVGAFNTPNLECLAAVLTVAEENKQPVIISHAELHESVSPLAVIGPVMVMMAKQASVPVCVHLDHGESLPYLKRALEIGFTSIMYDGSLLSHEQNAVNTCKAVEMASPFHASVEAELGILGGREAGAQTAVAAEDMYTDPADAERFVKETGIDALAASFGTAHGIYNAKPKLDFERVAAIRKVTGVPVVMHGGSGCTDEDYQKAIQSGVRKINYYSYMAREGVRAAQDLLATEDVTFFHDIAHAAQAAMKKDVHRAIKVFANLK